MTKISCNADICSHNNSGTCYANCVDIGGTSAGKDCGTCCGSFLNKLNYSELTSSTLSSGECNCLICTATNCQHNDNKACSLESIDVAGSKASIYTEVHCSSFETE